MAKSLEEMTVPELMAETKRLQESSELFNTMLSDPATRKEALKLVKKNNPKLPIPEIDAESAAGAMIAEERTKREALEKKVQEREILDRIDRERARVMKQHDLTDADMVEVEKLMVDEKAPIPHYDAAAKVYKASRVLATPTSSALSAPTYEMPKKDVWGKGVGNRAELNKIALNEAYSAFNEITGRSPKAAA